MILVVRHRYDEQKFSVGINLTNRVHENSSGTFGVRAISNHRGPSTRLKYFKVPRTARRFQASSNIFQRCVDFVLSAKPPQNTKRKTYVLALVRPSERNSNVRKGGRYFTIHFDVDVDVLRSDRVFHVIPHETRVYAYVIDNVRPTRAERSFQHCCYSFVHVWGTKHRTTFMRDASFCVYDCLNRTAERFEVFLTYVCDHRCF